MHDIAARQYKLSTLEQVFRSILGKLGTGPERWGLSLYGWLTIMLSAVGVSAFVFFTIYPFLAVTETIPGEILVVEDWVRDYAISAAVDEANHRGTTEIFTTGGPARGSGTDRSVYGTMAHVSASQLRAY